MKSNSNIIAMAGVALALDSETRNAARIRALELQVEQLEEKRVEAAQREAAYRENVGTLLAHIESVVDGHNWGKLDQALWNAVTEAPAAGSDLKGAIQ